MNNNAQAEPAQRRQVVSLANLTGAELRQLADLADSRPARLQARADERLRRHLVRLAALMPVEVGRQVLDELARFAPSVVLAAHFDDCLEARDRRQALPPDERGEGYFAADAVADDGDEDTVALAVAA